MCNCEITVVTFLFHKSSYKILLYYTTRSFIWNQSSNGYNFAVNQSYRYQPTYISLSDELYMKISYYIRHWIISRRPWNHFNRYYNITAETAIKTIKSEHSQVNTVNAGYKTRAISCDFAHGRSLRILSGPSYKPLRHYFKVNRVRV